MVIDFEGQDPVEAILDASDDQGMDSVIEVLGLQASFEGCIKATIQRMACSSLCSSSTEG